jgi:hypothetical protein
MARTAKRWGQPPSRWLGLSDEVTAYAFDEAMAMALDIADLRAARGQEADKAAGSTDNQPSEGGRYATEADVADWAEGDD